MSSDFYFRKWKQALGDLEMTVKLDVEYQETKAHDQKRCDATHRLSHILSQYMHIYNQVWECLHHNLQMQKSIYMQHILQAVVARIIELKNQLKKLEVSQYHFLCDGLIEIKRTTDDVELTEIPHLAERPEHIQAIIDEVFEKCKQKKRFAEENTNDEQSMTKEITHHWWDDDFVEEEEKVEVEVKTDKPTPEQLEMKKHVETIQTMERSRQVIKIITQKYDQRQKWEKEIRGTAKAPATLEIREKSAKLIQEVCRAYFELKRENQKQYRRDELLGLKPCRTKESSNFRTEKLSEEERNRHLKRKFEADLKMEQEKLKQDFLARKGDEIGEDYRDKIREWFKQWYEAINMFHEIPDEKNGGVTVILKEDLPSPSEWLEKYTAYLNELKTNKNKTALEKKYEKMLAKREIIMKKKEERIKKKLEDKLRIKLMKNPTLHPGFIYPQSTKTKHILEVLGNYYKDWADLDGTEAMEVKQGHVHQINKENAYMQAKLEIIATVDEDVRNDFKLLNAALKRDYENNDEKIPKSMKKSRKQGNKKRKLKKTLSGNIAEKFEALILQGFVTEYPKTKLEDFIGDPNFSGGDLRCDYRLALPYNGETRNVWWDQCRQLAHGFHRILLVGPTGSGKTKLLHILASLNDAVLFELDATGIRSELLSAVYLQQAVSWVATCARALQPAVIHIKDVHRLFYKQIPPQDGVIDWDMIRNCFVKKLFKKIRKSDKITVVGSCIEPWVAKSKDMIKQFPNVVLLPNTTHSTVAQMLNKWVNSHPVIPEELDISSLAHVLKGYSFGFLMHSLYNFLTPDRIVRIAARGLSPAEIHDFILEDSAEQVDYDRYIKWYTNKITWGKKEKKHLEEQVLFRKAVEEYKRKSMKKKLMLTANSTATSFKT